jgi:MFS family permease
LARGLRALADGYVSILLPAYLLALGLDTFEVGILATATLLGSASLTLCVGFITSRFGHRRPLVVAGGVEDGHRMRLRRRVGLLAAAAGRLRRYPQAVERRRQRLSAAGALPARTIGRRP